MDDREYLDEYEYDTEHAPDPVLIYSSGKQVTLKPMTTTREDRMSKCDACTMPVNISDNYCALCGQEQFPTAKKAAKDLIGRVKDMLSVATPPTEPLSALLQAIKDVAENKGQKLDYIESVAMDDVTIEDFQKVAEAYAAQQTADFAKVILHGDDAHRQWLLDAVEAFNSCKPLPEPKGQADTAELTACIAVLVHALNWAGGARDFQLDGVACEAWEKVARPALINLPAAAQAHLDEVARLRKFYSEHSESSHA